jgi:TolB-like protein
MGCATSQIVIDSDPKGASVYKADSEQGPWMRVITDNPVTPMVFPVPYNPVFIKAKKYGYEDSKVIVVSPEYQEETIQLALPKQLENMYDPLYDSFISKVNIKEEEKKTIAVCGFQATGKDYEQDARIFSGLIQDCLLKTGCYNIVARNDIDIVFAEIKFQNIGYTDANKAAEIGRILNAQEIVIGSFARLGSKKIINMALIEVSTGKVQSSDTVEYENAEKLGDAAVQLTNRLIHNRFEDGKNQ